MDFGAIHMPEGLIFLKVGLHFVIGRIVVIEYLPGMSLQLLDGI